MTIPSARDRRRHVARAAVKEADDVAVAIDDRRAAEPARHFPVHREAKGQSVVMRDLRSAARFAERLMVRAERATDAHDAPDATVVSIGPALIFERLWRETGCQAVVRTLLATRHHHFDVERAVFMTVLHRLMVSGSDRSALQWRRDQAIDGVAALELQHLYRAMGWLGEALGEPDGAPSPRRTKDLIEEALFARRRDLFTDLDLVFFDTTSVFFTGEGGESLGQYGKSKDRRSDCKQMVLGMVIDGDGIPVCSEMWPGNTTDVTTLGRVAERLQRRFGVRRVAARPFVEAHPQQLHLDLLDLVGLRRRDRGQQPADRIQGAIGIVAGESLLVRPPVAVPAQFADETALGGPQDVAKDIVPGFPHQLEQSGCIPLGNGLVRQQRVFRIAAQLVGILPDELDGPLDLALDERAKTRPEQVQRLAHPFVIGDGHNVSPSMGSSVAAAGGCFHRRTMNRLSSSTRSGSVPLCARMPATILRGTPRPVASM